LDTIGDVLMTTPAIRALKESRRGRRITLLTSSAGAGIAGLVPEIDRVMVYDAPWMKAAALRETSRPDTAMVKSLRAEDFDAAVIFTVFSQNPLPSAFLCYLAEIPLRLAHCHENPYQLLTDWVPDPEPTQFIRHEVRRQLDLVGSVGCATQNERLSVQAPSRARQQVRQILRAMGIDRARPWVVVHPGASAPSRRYPPENFVEVANKLVIESELPVVFTGTGTESELVDQIRRAMRAPSYSLAGQLDLAQLTALVEMAPLLITNNTGPAHVAAAVGTPVVVLYALTNPQHQPWQVPNRVLYHDVPCKFCYKSICPEGHQNCLRLVTPDQVVQASIELLRDKEHESCTHWESMQHITTQPPAWSRMDE
jgi:lipopolysaccharide heptosyltransferase II